MKIYIPKEATGYYEITETSLKWSKHYNMTHIYHSIDDVLDYVEDIQEFTNICKKVYL